MDGGRPAVSVVIAAYNRSNVLRLALETVRAQTFADWEAWVVGDACTDDTGDVVAALGDPRIRFVNLERNVGEQSGPNNEGFRRARGRYIAYLGQDDLWWPDHLERCVEQLERTGADFVFSLVDLVMPSGARWLGGATTTGRYEPWVYTLPSSWVLRRDVLEEVGPWRRALELYTTPQEDLLGRSHRAGKDMRLVPALTVVKFTSSDRPGAYLHRESHENEAFLEQLRNDPGFRERELTLLALEYAGRDAEPAPLRLHASRATRDTVRRLLTAAGVPSYAFHDLIRHPRRAGKQNHLRRLRGLGPLERD
jgi:glycosyltransferase involved in cell wall biosynthesis